MKFFKVIFSSPSVLLFLVAVAGGCSQKPPALLPLSPFSPVMDVPVPVGFQIDRDRSQATVVPHSSLRLINQEYRGSAPASAVARFYRHRLPPLRWKSLGQTRVRGSWILFFNKNREDCTITIVPGWFFTHLYLVVAPIP